jgi:hypothetical protein
MLFTHDLFAKYVFRNLDRAREELRHAVGPEVAALIDWDTLTPGPTELVDEALAARYTDLRFSALLLGTPIHLELLFEHQSRIDPWMPVRFFCHTGAIWNEVRQTREVGDVPPEVPLVLSVLLSCAARPWSGPLHLWQVIRGGAILQRLAPSLLPTLPILVDDLQEASDEEIKARPQSPEVRLALLLMKHVRRGDAVRVLEEEGELVQQAREDVLREEVRYVLHADPQASIERVGTALKRHLGDRGEEVVMTGQQLIQQGIEQGLQQGIEKGIEKGRAEARAALVRVLFRTLATRGVAVPDDIRDRIVACTDLDCLERWAERALTEPSAAQVIAQ